MSGPPLPVDKPQIKTQIIHSFFLRRISSVWSGLILVTAKMNGTKAIQAIMPAINYTYHITGKHKGVGYTPPSGQTRGVSKIKTQITHLLSQKDITNNVWSGVFLVTAEMKGIKVKQAIKPAINEAHHVVGKHKGVRSRKISPIMYGLAYFLSLLR